jgi:hypothetical protein
MVTLDLSGKWTVRLCAGILGVGFSSRWHIRFFLGKNSTLKSPVRQQFESVVDTITSAIEIS